MPNGNRKGPSGAGSVTGRGRGFCNGTAETVRPEPETVQGVAVKEQQLFATTCRGPRGCGNGVQGTRGGCGARRGRR